MDNKVVIPKAFESSHDLECMILSSLLGTLVSLQNDLISFAQAENYWLSDISADLFEQFEFSQEIADLIKEGTALKELLSFPALYHQRLNELIQKTKNMIAQYYTDYNTNKEMLN